MNETEKQIKRVVKMYHIPEAIVRRIIDQLRKAMNAALDSVDSAPNRSERDHGMDGIQNEAAVDSMWAIAGRIGYNGSAEKGGK